MIRTSGNPLRGCRDGRRSPPVHSCGAVLCTSHQSRENRNSPAQLTNPGGESHYMEDGKDSHNAGHQEQRSKRSACCLLVVPKQGNSPTCTPVLMQWRTPSPPREDGHNSRVGQVPHDTLASGEDQGALTEPETRKDIPTPRSTY